MLTFNYWHTRCFKRMPDDGTVRKSVSPQSSPEGDHFFDSAHKIKIT